MTENNIHIPRGRGRIFIAPLGVVDGVAVRVVAANLQTFFDLPADIEKPRPCPVQALMPARNQYHAAKLMTLLENNIQESEKRIGITSEDITLPILTHVFGEAQINGRVAVISTARLKGAPSGPSPPKALFYERLAKIALHEAGHLWGLTHCRDTKCLMGFSAGLDSLDALPPAFCPSCTSRLRPVL